MSILKTYDNICRYDIKHPVQQLDINIDADSIQHEILNLIERNHYGFQSASLRLPAGRTDWLDHNEVITKGGDNVEGEDYSEIKWGYRDIQNTDDGTAHTQWHPGTAHVQSLCEQLQTYSGLTITRARLVWMPVDYAYPMHCDYEAIRFHIPIVTNPNCLFMHGDHIYRMPYGHVHHIITDDVHTASNYGMSPRLHLVFSTYTDADIHQQIRLSVEQKLQDTPKTMMSEDLLLRLLKIAYHSDNKLAKYYASKLINTVDEKDGS